MKFYFPIKVTQVCESIKIFTSTPMSNPIRFESESNDVSLLSEISPFVSKNRFTKKSQHLSPKRLLMNETSSVNSLKPKSINFLDIVRSKNFLNQVKENRHESITKSPKKKIKLTPSENKPNSKVKNCFVKINRISDDQPKITLQKNIELIDKKINNQFEIVDLTSDCSSDEGKSYIQDSTNSTTNKETCSNDDIKKETQISLKSLNTGETNRSKLDLSVKSSSKADNNDEVRKKIQIDIKPDDTIERDVTNELEKLIETTKLGENNSGPIVQRNDPQKDDTIENLTYQLSRDSNLKSFDLRNRTKLRPTVLSNLNHLQNIKSNLNETDVDKNKQMLNKINDENIGDHGMSINDGKLHDSNLNPETKSKYLILIGFLLF